MKPLDPTLLHDFPDRMMRWLLENPGNLRELLGAAVPDLAPGFDCDRAELQPPAFPLDDWRHREADLLFLIPYRTGKGKRKVLVCVLIEHQSAADPRMPLRVLLYTVLFWEREWKRWEDQPAPRPEFRLTPVLPIVFHTGARPWSAPRAVADLVGGPDAFRAFVPQYGPLFWDLAEQSPEVLLASAAEWLRALTVIRAEAEDHEEFFRVMREVVERIKGLASRDKVRWHGLMWFVLAWALQRRPREEREALTALAAAAQEDVLLREEVRTMGQTIADELREEGKKEGALQCVQETLISVLRKKFGRVPKPLRQRIEATTDVARLQACVIHASTADSLDDLPL
jgi:hypothetical protein